MVELRLKESEKNGAADAPILDCFYTYLANRRNLNFLAFLIWSELFLRLGVSLTLCTMALITKTAHRIPGFRETKRAN